MATTSIMPQTFSLFSTSPHGHTLSPTAAAAATTTVMTTSPYTFHAASANSPTPSADDGMAPPATRKKQKSKTSPTTNAHGHAHFSVSGNGKRNQSAKGNVDEPAPSAVAAFSDSAGGFTVLGEAYFTPSKATRCDIDTSSVEESGGGSMPLPAFRLRDDARDAELFQRNYHHQQPHQSGTSHPTEPNSMHGYGDGSRYTSAPYHASPSGQHHNNNSRDKRLHQDFKSLTKAERQRVVQREAADSDLLARTVHLRFLPTSMKQGELATLCNECGPYLRVRICGNSTDNQNWIYGFVEFETREAAWKLMQMNGRELSNGEGRPLLRLKCHTANQPIVDRVFHDADPASKSPCIFGQGSFENRTLKDALDSYFNLKAKEQRQAHLSGGGGAGSLGVMMCGVEGISTTGADSQEQAVTPSDNTSTSSTVGGAGDGHHTNSTAGGRSQLRANAQAFMPASTTTSRSSHTLVPAPAYLGVGGETVVGDADFQHNFSVSNPPTPQIPQHSPPAYLMVPPLASEEEDAMPLPMAFSTEESALPSAPLHRSPALLSQTSTGSGIHAPFGQKFSTLPNVDSENAGGVLPSAEEVDMLLSRTMETMIGSHLAINGEEVVQLCAHLIQRAIEQGSAYMVSKQQFFDTAGTLEHLLEKLDAHEALTGRATDTCARDYTSELPQKVTQLRLLANLMLTLLHLAKRSVRDALPFTHALIRCVMEVPQEPLEFPLPLAQPHNLSAAIAMAAAAEGGMSDFDSLQNPMTLRMLPPSSPGPGPGAENGDDVDDERRRKDGATEIDFDPLSFQDMGSGILTAKTLLEHVLESEDEEEDGASKYCRVPQTADEGVENATDGVLHSHTVGMRNDGAGTPQKAEALEWNARGAEQIALYHRDVHFHRYVLNVLICAGMAMEEVMPELSAQIYASAIHRAEKVLHTTSASVQRCATAMAAAAVALESSTSTAMKRQRGTGYPRLTDDVRRKFPSLSACSSATATALLSEASGVDTTRDVTMFPRLFFQSAFQCLQQPLQQQSPASEEDRFWKELPPLHMVDYFFGDSIGTGAK